MCIYYSMCRIKIQSTSQAASLQLKVFAPEARDEPEDRYDRGRSGREDERQVWLTAVPICSPSFKQTFFRERNVPSIRSKQPCYLIQNRHYIVCILVLPSLCRLNGPENLGGMSGTVTTGAMMLGMVTIVMSATATGSLGCEFLRA